MAIKTRLKVYFINAVMVAGAAVIIVVQGPEAMKPHGYGYAVYDEGLAARVFLAALLTGIPVVLYAAAVHVLLTYLLLKPDELKAYRARQLLDTIEPRSSKRVSSPPVPAPIQTTREKAASVTPIIHDD